jgi:hypothetical protein
VKERSGPAISARADLAEFLHFSSEAQLQRYYRLGNSGICLNIAAFH